MSPIVHQVSQTTDLGWVMGVMTLVFLGSFMAWSWYAWNPKNKAIHEASSLLPLDDSEA